MAYGAFNLARYGWELKKELRETQKKVAELAKKKQEFEKYRMELETKEAVEKRAKERLNLKLSGEKVVVLIPQASAVSIDNSGQSSAPWAIWNQIRNFFSRISAFFGF